MKHYLFLTKDGTAKDDSGVQVNNCQQIADVVIAETALDAYNKLLRNHGFYGNFDTCFCYELADNGRVHGRFDLINDSD